MAAGCAPRAIAPFAFPADVRYAAGALDSLDLTRFGDLAAPQRELRRREAALAMDRAAGAPSLAARLRHLHTAAGLAPDQPRVWLSLLELARQLGDYQLADERLAGLRSALQGLSRTESQPLRAEAAAVLAWLCYERGEWSEGLAWVDSIEVAGRQRDLLLEGLLYAGGGPYLRAEDIARRISRQFVFAADVRWIHGMAEWYRGNPELAQAIMRRSIDLEFRVETQVGPDDFARGELRPDPEHAAACWRDLGMLEEVLGNWSEARRNYERARAAHSRLDERSIVRRDHRNLRGSRDPLPVWLAFDRTFVTGSLSAYTALAYGRYSAAKDPAAREFWAGAAIDAAGQCVRRQLDVPWALRTRGLLLVSAGRRGEGMADLESAWRQLARLRQEDFATAATLGHLYLQDDRPAVALAPLKAAVRLRPAEARPWADLGLALILTGDLAGAEPVLTRAIETDARLAVGWYNRGLLYYHGRRWREAVADLERAVSLAPGDLEIQRALEQARTGGRVPGP